MKHNTKTFPTLWTAAFCALVLGSPCARGNNISGSIAFGAEGVVVNTPNLADASSFYVDTTVGGLPVDNVAYVGEIPQGSYSSVPLMTPVTFNGFTFNPPVASITPLWTFALGPAGDQTVYSFDATSVMSDWNASRDEWDIGGSGIAMITGYDSTPGTWTVNLSETGASFAFDATSGANAAVPDGGSTVLQLGGAFLGLGVLGRTLRR